MAGEPLALEDSGASKSVALLPRAAFRATLEDLPAEFCGHHTSFVPADSDGASEAPAQAPPPTRTEGRDRWRRAGRGGRHGKTKGRR